MAGAGPPPLKVGGLFKALPKAIRNNLLPLQDHVTLFLEEQDGSGEGGKVKGEGIASLLEALARLAVRCAWQIVSAGDRDYGRYSRPSAQELSLIDARAASSRGWADLPVFKSPVRPGVSQLNVPPKAEPGNRRNWS